MDLSSELTTLAATGATQLVGAVAADTWPAVKSGVLALWRRARPERVAEDLEDAREQLLAAEEAGADPAGLRVLLVNEWQARLARLLVTHPGSAGELRALVDGLLAEGGRRAPGSVAMTAYATGGGSVYQAGRDLTVHRPAAG
ncbi:hypothetical protein ACFVFS_24820 [Kitasatospora sp. NPDC057692]|uniref:hypothetical protein n=1 Tax=Kitasatospora sp. NPDC057692 TaxID=3346215 RepID=UPI0036AEAE83